MSYIETNPIQHATILRIYSEKDEIIVDPEYQRNSNVWTPEKRQLLIDSILNNYDIPKLYFHQFDRDTKKETGKSYAIIDGKQRLDTIWRFIDGKFCLADDFVYQDDPTIKLAGLSYDDLSKEFPKLKIKFDSFVLPIVGIMTDDLDLIEDMFFRLNEAVPLNSAEKRNAFGGEMVKTIRQLSLHKFFTNKVKFGNKRYEHFEVAARLLLVEVSPYENGKYIDTKKVYLDSMVKRYKVDPERIIEIFFAKISSVLDVMTSCFVDDDVLLRAQGAIVVYYLLFKWAIENQIVISRSKLISFSESVKTNRELAEDHYEQASYDLLEYDRFSQHGTNDVSNIKERLRILQEYFQT